MRKEVAKDGCDKVDAGAFKSRICVMCGEKIGNHSSRMLSDCLRELAKLKRKDSTLPMRKN